MDSLRFSAVPDIYESKSCKLVRNFDSYVRNFKEWSLNRKNLFQISCNPSSIYKSRQTIVFDGLEANGLEKELQSNENYNVGLIAENLTLKNPDSRLVEVINKTSKDSLVRKNERKIWSRVIAMNKTVNRREKKQTSEQNGKVKETGYRREECNRFEDVVSMIKPERSVEHCNSILRLLETSNTDKAIEFFSWMKSNGKVKGNATAYNLTLRALARKEQWNIAKSLLEEMTSESNCKLTSQVFNALIFVCSKRGLVEWADKWFAMMLEKRVEPNIATIGMLMKLYQKNLSMSQAEFTFDQMKMFKIQCVSAYSSLITIYTRLGLYDKAEKIIILMEQDKIIPNLENWLVRINTFSQQGKLDEAELTLRSMMNSGISPNIVAYNTLITGYGKISDMKRANTLFQNLGSRGVEPDETTYRSMIEGLGRTDNYKEALFYYKELIDKGFKPNSSNFYTMINLQARHKDDKGIIKTLEDMRGIRCQYSSILSTLLQAYERVGRMYEIPLILKASFYENILLDPTSCSILVLAYVQNSLLDEAIQVMQEKKWKDPDFEGNLYHLLICSCKEGGNYHNAVKIFSQMPKSEDNPNLHIICSMIDIYCASNNFSDAENLYLMLKDSKVKLDMIAYNIVVRMYIKLGSLENACLVFETMEKQKDIIPDTYLFRDMLRTYQRCNMHEKLASVYYRLLRSGVVWDEAMYNCVINCCGRALPVDELSRLFDEMIQCSYAANTITFNIMIDIYGKAGLLRKARKLFWIARKQGVADVISYNTMIAAYGNNKDFKRMRSIVNQMKQEGFPVSLEAYNCMLHAYGKNDLIAEFNGVLEKMKESRCSSDHYTYNIMIDIYGKKGWIEEVANVLDELKERGMEPDLYSYNCLIKAYGIAGMAEEAVNVVQEMRMKGIKPDRITFASLISALQRNENFLEAVKWSLWMKQMEISS